VSDEIDTSPEFTRPIFAAGINTGDKVRENVTTFTVNIRQPVYKILPLWSFITFMSYSMDAKCREIAL
jgi:hypothetical protein